MLSAPRARAVLATVLLLAASYVHPCVAQAQDSQKKVLVIYSTRRDTQFSIVGDRTMPDLLEKGLGAEVDFYSEHIDGARFPEEQYAKAFHDYLRLKYHDAHFDVIVVTHTLALQFISANRDELFPGVPVVYFSDDAAVRRLPNSAGVLAARDYLSTINLIRALQPDTRDVFVILGHSARDLAAEAVARAQFAAHASGLRFTYSSDLTTDALERRLKALPEHAVVYYILFYQDAAGVNVTPLEYLDRVAAIANRPVYSWVDSTLGHGVIGGGFSSVARQIQSVAALAVRVLNGEPPDGIPLVTANTVEAQVDSRQLDRWRISESRVPADARLLFRSSSVWERYRVYIVGVALLLFAQSALIALLLVQRRRLRVAEETVLHGEADLQASRERIRDLGGRLLAAQEAERSRIAFELHDDVSQQLAVLTMNLQMLCGFGSGLDDEAEAVARESLSHADNIARSLRDLSHRLYPTKLRLLGLVPAIASLERDFAAGSLAVQFSHDNVPTGLPHELTLALYRVVQEALRNAVAHSQAREVHVHLTERDHALVLTIVDDGVGFDVERVVGDGLGLISMRERLDPVGGALTITSHPGEGTRIQIVVPGVTSAPHILAV